MKKAWIENNQIREIAPGNPDVLYHPDIAKHFDTDVPDEVQAGWTLVEGQWVEPEPPAPYVPPPLTPEQLREAAKAARELAVSQITVTTAAGNVFDGDETSQNRMARAILALQATGTPTTLWVLSDNSVIEASVAELAEALALSGAAQSALWVIE